MSDKFSARRVMQAFGSVLGYLQDLADNEMDGIQTKLRLFVNACELDDVMRRFVWHWHLAQRQAMEWYQKRAVGQEGTLPETEPEYLSFAYSLLFLASRRKIEPRSLIVNCFEGGVDLARKLENFKETLIHPLQRGLTARLAWLEENVSPDAEFDIDELADQLLNQLEDGAELELPAAAEEPEPEPAPPPKPAPHPKPAPARAAASAQPEPTKPAPEPAAGPYAKQLREIAALVERARYKSSGEKADRMTDVRILELELGKHQPDLLRVKDLLRELEKGSRTKLTKASRSLLEELASAL